MDLPDPHPHPPDRGQWDCERGAGDHFRQGGVQYRVNTEEARRGESVSTRRLRGKIRTHRIQES